MIAQISFNASKERATELLISRGFEPVLPENSRFLTRYIPLHPVLQELAADMPVRSWWFPSWVGNHRYTAGGPVLGNSVSDSISKTMNRAGVPGKPHALRHWFVISPAVAA